MQSNSMQWLSAKTRFVSCNISFNVLQNCVLSFATCSSSWSPCVADNIFSMCFRLSSINIGTWFSPDLRCVDELCFIDSIYCWVCVLCTQFINSLLDQRQWMRLNWILMMMAKKMLLMKLHFNLMIILVIHYPCSTLI